MLTLHGGQLNKVPVLHTPLTRINYAKLKRLTHAAIVPRQQVCYIPAYAPILTYSLRELKNIFGSYTLNKRGQEIVNGYKKLMESYKEQILRDGFEFALQPYAHQRRSLLDIIYNFRWNLSLDPGLGKTKIIIDYLRYLGKKALILAPTSLLENWIDEFELHDPKGECNVRMFGEGYKPKRIQQYDSDGNPTKKKPESASVGKHRWIKELDDDVTVLLVGYHSAAEYRKSLLAYYDYDIIVLDESHRIKSFKGKNSEGARELSQKAYRRVTMSGTYLLNSPVDAWPQLDFLSPQILNDPFYSFRNKYCDFHQQYRHQIVGYKNLDQLNKVIGRFSTRFTKENVTGMPKRTVIERFYNLTTEQAKWYDNVLSEDDLLFEDGNILKEHKVVLLGKLAQISKGYVYLSNKDPQICNDCPDLLNCVEHKLKPYTPTCSKETKDPAPTKRRMKLNPALNALMTLLDELLGEPKHKVIIWCKGIEEQEIIKEKLTSEEIEFVQITDATSTIEKVKNFNTEKTIRVLLSSIAKGIGYTANSAQFSIYFSMGFSLEHYKQSRDRNYRINTKHPVWEYHLLGRHSIDSEIIRAINNKTDVVDSLVDSSTCDLCLQKEECAKGGIQKFQKGCKFKKKVSRKTINTTTLKPGECNE